MKPVKVGCIGCGNISHQYFRMQRNFPVLEMVACADLDRSKAEAAAKTYGVPRVLAVEELIASADVEIVLNLTIPQAHVSVARAALEQGKHCYMEKPLGVDREEALALVELARQTQLRIGCAPDTVMGAGIQTARKLIDEGTIGRPVGFQAFMYTPGHERWHPAPEFYYKPGGGPMMDMGPYYLTALLNLLGPMKRVMGFATVAIGERTIASEPLKGRKVTVETPDHYVGAIEFESGAAGVIAQSFAVEGAEYDGQHPIMIFGTDGAMKVPDPNQFDGSVQLFRDGAYEDQPHAFIEGYGRAVGLADMAHAIRKGRPHRCSLEQAYCVLDAMIGFRDASESGRAHLIEMPYERPAPMPADLPFGELD